MAGVAAGGLRAQWAIFHSIPDNHLVEMAAYLREYD